MATDGANEIWTSEAEGEGTVVLNTTDFSTSMVHDSIEREHPEVASMIRWGRQVHRNRRGGLLERDKYVTPTGMYDQMRVAQDAARTDDVVSGFLESTEALAFSRMSVQSDDEDEEDIWAQIMEDIDLDSRIREMWREMSIVSQFYVGVWWGLKDYQVRGRDRKTGVKRKKQFKRLRVPIGITMLDPMKIVPVGNFMFRQEQLAWAAQRDEASYFDNVLTGMEQDETIKRLIVGKYNSNDLEQQRLGRLGIGPAELYLLSPDNVYRETSTRPDYEPFADVRMKSIFDLLDLKALLRELDRAMLLGATNFIVLIRKGSEHMPAKQAELSALQASVRTMSQLPVIVGDHRLEIDIITPKLDTTLTPEKYNTIDARITARLYQILMTGNFAAGAKGDDSLKLVRIIARGLESRRGLLRRSIDRNILMKIYERNEAFTEIPRLEFHPKTVAIDFDPGLAAYLMDLLDRHAISRGTLLEQIDLDEDDEARILQREKDFYDGVFNPLTPLTDPKQAHDFRMQEQDEQQKDLIELRKIDQKNKLALLDEEQLAPKAVGVPAKKGTPTGDAPTGPNPPAGGGSTTVDHHVKTTTVVKKAPGNSDPKSAGRTQGGNRSGGGAAPGTGQGQPADPRRKAKG